MRTRQSRWIGFLGLGISGHEAQADLISIQTGRHCRQWRQIRCPVVFASVATAPQFAGSGHWRRRTSGNRGDTGDIVADFRMITQFVNSQMAGQQEVCSGWGSGRP